jgi:hypothetical protein
VALTRYAGWANIVAGIAVGVVMVGVGLGIVGVLTGVVMVLSGVFMVWLAAGWDKPLADTAELHKYGRPANAVVLAVDEVTLDGAGGRTAKVKFQVAPVNESDFITTRTVELPGGKVPSVGETVTVKFDPKSRKNVILLEQAYEVVDHTTAAHRMFSGSGPTTLALAALFALMLAAPAGAAVTKVAQAPLGSGVELAGQSVVFGGSAGGGRVVRANPDGTLTVLKQFTPPGGDDDPEFQTFYTTGFAASDKQVAVSDWYEGYAKAVLAQSDFRIYTAPISGGTVSQLFQCGGNHPYDVDGDRLAYLGDDCTEKSPGGPRVIVRNLGAAGNPVVGSFPMTRQPNTLDLAGDNVALSGFFNSGPEVVIYSITGTEQYKLNHNFAQYSLQADGKIALAQTEQVIGASETCRIEWFSKAEPVPHRIEFCPRGVVRLAGDRIAYDRLEGSAVSLNVVDLSGNNNRAFTFFDPGRGLTGFDFDGSKLAYGSRACHPADDAVWVDDLTGPTDQPTVEGGLCPAAIQTKSARSTSKGIVRMKVFCEEGCVGDLNLYSGKSVASRKPARVSIARGKSKTIPIKLRTLKDVRAKGSKVYSARVSVQQHGSTTRTFKRAVRVLEPN